MAGEEDWVVLECRDPTLSTEHQTPTLSVISISTAEISSWDLPKILSHQIVEVKARQSRLIEYSSYFRGLFTGSFSESWMHRIPIQWSLETFLHILMFIHGYELQVTFHNILPLCQGALYFGVEMLLLECRKLFSDSTLHSGIRSSQIQLDYLIRIWEFGLDHAIDWIPGLCTSYIAKNFMWAMACASFVDVPYNLLLSCVTHPDLTVDSERHLCEAMLAWLYYNVQQLKPRSNGKDDCTDESHHTTSINDYRVGILKEIRVHLLPSWFIIGKHTCWSFSSLAEQGITAIFSLLERSSMSLLDMSGNGDSSRLRVRLTESLERVDLSGCPQINLTILLLSVLPYSYSVNDLLRENVIKQSSNHLEYFSYDSNLPISSFNAVQEIDISKCTNLHLDSAIECFSKSFPFLRTIKAAYFMEFETTKLHHLVQKCASIHEVDLTVDVSPVIPSQVSVLYSGSVTREVPRRYMNDLPHGVPALSKITKLTLEGRSDFNDSYLHLVSEFCVSLYYLNIKGCLSMTDIGISNLLEKTTRLHSLIACDTLFGRNSISALCTRVSPINSSTKQMEKKNLESLGINLEMLHIGGCVGANEASLLQILSQACMLKSLCLRGTCVLPNMLYNFSGYSLEMLDVSNTTVSGEALSHTIRRNPGLKCLKARGCKNLFAPGRMHHEGVSVSIYPGRELDIELGKACKLEELSMGWGFSFYSLDAMGPALTFLKVISIGLGGSLGEAGLLLLPTLCPFLESVTLLFQVMSDCIIIKLMETLRKLEAVALCYCIGDTSLLSFKHSVPTLRKLRLERVVPWLTNESLVLLAQNMANLMELSLVGCARLNADAQQIISSGWPGLIKLHLEDCGAVTENGVNSLLDCKALGDLLLRHNGPGIRRNFIIDAASKLPMLRHISLDWCDASEGEFDLPHFVDRYSLSSVTIARCKLKNCTLDFQNVKAQKRPVHKETLVLTWNSTCLQRTLVKERIPYN